LKKILIIDFSQMSYRAQTVKVQQSMEVSSDFFTYNILLQIQKAIKQFSPTEIVLAIDCSSWRKDFYKHYKAQRVRTESDLEMFKLMDQLIIDLKNVFPYKVIKLPKTEADDIIATLCFNKKPDDIIYILSSDFDFIQLKTDKVILYNPYTDELLGEEWPCKIKGNLFTCKEEYIAFHVYHGDPGDNIFNFHTGEEEIEKLKSGEMKHQKSFGHKFFQNYFRIGLDKMIMSECEKQNLERNKRLVLLNKENIPVEIQNSIMDCYNNYKLIIDNELVTTFLESKNIQSLIENVDKLFPFPEQKPFF